MFFLPIQHPYMVERKGYAGKELSPRHGQADWPDIEIASLDYLIDQGVEISTRGEMVEPLF
jgi:hypothetical protein